MALLIQTFFSPRVGGINILHIFTSADCGLINTVLQAIRSTIGSVRTIRLREFRFPECCLASYHSAEVLKRLQKSHLRERIGSCSTPVKLKMYTSTGEREVVLRIGLYQPKS